MTKKYDIAIIGAGPGGYVAALHAAHLNKSVCLIEKSAIGGTCLNRGCIPTKAYAASRDALLNVRLASQLGITIPSHEVDFKEIHDRKNKIVMQTRNSVVELLAGNGAENVRGTGRIIGANSVEVENHRAKTKTIVEADNIIIATGSETFVVNALPVDHKRVITSGDVIRIDTLPKDIVIVGGGIIGCEFASILSTFGVKVTIVELMDSILCMVDKQIARIVRDRFKNDGIEMLTGVKADGVEIKDDCACLKLSDGKEISTEMILVAVGRTPNTKGIGLEEVGITTERGRIIVDDEMRTNVKNIFAIGDITPGPMLAHKASAEGICAVNNAAGIETKSEPFENIPAVIFTYPEIACVGLDGKMAREKGIEVSIGRVAYDSSSKAHCMGEPEGMIKVIAKKDSGVIIGGSICGAHAGDLIHILSVAVKNKLQAKDVYETIFAHPTLSELIKEAAEDVDGIAVHKIKRKTSQKKFSKRKD
ncbi:dihydrolipoyl dehydrogenase [Thermodesulfobacteriota bacterium]